MLERARLPSRALPRWKIATRDVLRRRGRVELHLGLSGATSVPLPQRTLLATTWDSPWSLLALLDGSGLQCVAPLRLLGGQRAMRLLALITMGTAVPAERITRQFGLPIV